MKTNGIFKTLLLVAAAFSLPSCTHELDVISSSSDLRFGDLATVWDEAMPLGNATVGTLVWQHDGKLRFSLDRSDLWDLRPVEAYKGRQYTFEWVKEHIKSGDYNPVIQILENSGDKIAAPSKIPGAAIEFDSQGWGQVSSSRLYMANALCQVEWDSGIRMQTFIQADKPVGWFVFDNVPEKFHLKLIPPRYNNDNTNQEGDGLGGSALPRLGYEEGVVEEGENQLTYHQEGWNGFSYDVAVKWKQQGKNRVVGVWSVTASTSDEMAKDVVEKALNKGLNDSYSHHMEYWKNYWQMSSVSVPDTLIQHQYDREMYKFGSASRKDSYPISLQSVWTADDGDLPPWKGDYHHDLNTQLSYWPAYAGNHLDEGMAYLNTLWNQRDTHKEFTRTFFGKDGLNVPGTCTLDGHPIPGWTPYTKSQTTSAWLAQHFYLHWKFSADNDFLSQRGYPYMRDVAVFLEQQTTVTDGGLRKLEYSSSPEINDNRRDAWFTDFTNFDLALIRFVFSAASEMADSLNIDDDAKHWKRLYDQMPAFSLDDDDALTIAPSMPYNVSHRHFSHTMAIHPLGLINIADGEKEKRIIEATLEKLHKYGPDWWCGYSYSWLANLEARAKHGDKACEALTTFAKCFCLRNSFHANGDQTKSGFSKFTYRPFTLEGNFAFAAGLQEMLIQSHTGIIEVFPAIPESWKDVAFHQLRAMGAFLVSAEMKNGKVVMLKVYSEKGGRMKLRMPQTGTIVEYNMRKGQTINIK